MTVPQAPTPDEVAMAAEFAFGLLDAAEAAAAEARERTDPAFAALVEQWRGHLADMVQGEAPAGTLPPPSVWNAIVAGTGAQREGGPDPAVGLRRARNRWRAAAGGLGAVAALLLGLLLAQTRPAPRPAEPDVENIALLETSNAPGVGAATYDATTNRLTIRLRHVDAGDRVPELWVIGGDGRPHSLGIVVTPLVWSRVAPAGTAGLLARGAKLAVSLEPRGGSPTGSPTGPVVLSGALS